MEKQQKRLRAECVACLLKKYMDKVPADTAADTALAYTQQLCGLMAEASPYLSAPEVVEQITALRRSLFGGVEDFGEAKVFFNRLICDLEPQLTERIRQAADPFLLALRLAMLGNYIDFAAMDTVDEKRLLEMLEEADSLSADLSEAETLRQELDKARRLVYLTDNCGEIGLDKLFILTLQQLFPSLQIDAIVRGAPVLNDATMADARQVGLDRVVRVIDNGTAVAGTSLARISPEARRLVEEADVIISKGQGNFETLLYCGKNVYYLFLCKCRLFADRLGVPLFTGMLLNDRRIGEQK
ncbi:MAG: DUF89 family protein [Clostridia bacterium]|nr:DUF89 family protein [Clostridia bacterium]